MTGHFIHAPTVLFAQPSQRSVNVAADLVTTRQRRRGCQTHVHECGFRSHYRQVSTERFFDNRRECRAPHPLRELGDLLLFPRRQTQEERSLLLPPIREFKFLSPSPPPILRQLH
jgi:hypothetical protein